MVLGCCFPSRPSPPPRNVAPALRRPLAARLQAATLRRARLPRRARTDEASLPDLLRRRGGAASLFSLCVLYATLARKLGVGLQLVRLSPPPGRTLRGPPFLLALGPAELFIDILAAGRLRTLSDLAQFLDGGDGDGGAVGRLSPAQLRAAAKPLDQRAVCLQLVRESEASSASVGRLAHAQFWSAQRELLEAYLRE
mmetsp:Transcript_16902/g.51220  ORF Transcript_16902/g.51220 Transcript_16902/m.51220 type:complete len:197 (-) Transcript_16902:1931-2521(-)